MCFSVDNPVSALSITEKWNAEVRHFCGRCPVILVACKADLRTDTAFIAQLKQRNGRLVPTEEGKRLAAQIKADAYMECSAKTREGVHELFLEAARLSLKKRADPKRGSKCVLN